MTDLPMPKRGVIWDPKRDSLLSLPSDAELTRKHREEIRLLARQMGVPTFEEIEARVLRENLLKMSTPSLPVDLPVRRAVQSTTPPEKPAKAKKDVVPTGYVKIGDLCKEWGIEPMQARASLRAKDVPKPSFGWAFAPADIPRIKQICGVK